MAIYAGLLATCQGSGMLRYSALTLFGKVHVFKVVAIATFQGIVGFQAAPFMFRQLKSFGFEFFAGY